MLCVLRQLLGGLGCQGGVGLGWRWGGLGCQGGGGVGQDVRVEVGGVLGCQGQTSLEVFFTEYS